MEGIPSFLVHEHGSEGAEQEVSRKECQGGKDTVVVTG